MADINKDDRLLKYCHFLRRHCCSVKTIELKKYANWNYYFWFHVETIYFTSKFCSTKYIRPTILLKHFSTYRPALTEKFIQRLCHPYTEFGANT